MLSVLCSLLFNKFIGPPEPLRCVNHQGDTLHGANGPKLPPRGDFCFRHPGIFGCRLDAWRLWTSQRIRVYSRMQQIPSRIATVFLAIHIGMAAQKTDGGNPKLGAAQVLGMPFSGLVGCETRLRMTPTVWCESSVSLAMPCDDNHVAESIGFHRSALLALPVPACLPAELFGSYSVHIRCPDGVVG